eukprot:TRINITY_DN14370_c0_g1_i1.p1 TRINITY_DN14370_c0_g1~~TRINITY_DN14370_c0_g1_i1.p1  ORF type:complete len:379 (+),score=138.42 TRINITY_DN14370_c0_g1_i1:37-1137(+)
MLRNIVKKVITNSNNLQQISKYTLSLNNLVSAQALKYHSFGNPEDVVKLEEFQVDSPSSNEVVVKMKAASINPADVNMIQGVYGIKPSLPATGGNEGVGEIESVGANVKNLKVGDVVIPSNPGLGTWSSHIVCGESDLTKVSKDIPVEYAATLSVNPCTAYRLLNDFVDLKEGDVIIQNGANSMVGQSVFQLARAKGVKTINVIRNRRDHADCVERMKAYGADMVVTEEYVLTPEYKKLVSDLPAPKLALNCVGGKSSTNLARCLGQDGTLVTYGGMSKRPIQIPTSLFIFKNINLKGFWLSEWVKQNSNNSKRQEMLDELSQMIVDKKLRFWIEKFPLEYYSDAFKEIAEVQRDRKAVFHFDKPT